MPQKNILKIPPDVNSGRFVSFLKINEVELRLWSTTGADVKTIQSILGQSDFKTTMDRYVHVTDDSMVKAVKQFQIGAET